MLLPGLSHIGATITFQDWITHWNLLAMNAPTATQVHLYIIIIYYYSISIVLYIRLSLHYTIC